VTRERVARGRGPDKEDVAVRICQREEVASAYRTRTTGGERENTGKKKVSAKMGGMKYLWELSAGDFFAHRAVSGKKAIGEQKMSGKMWEGELWLMGGKGRLVRREKGTRTFYLG